MSFNPLSAPALQKLSHFFARLPESMQHFSQQTTLTSVMQEGREAATGTESARHKKVTTHFHRHYHRLIASTATPPRAPCPAWQPIDGR